jgi:molybdopterin converting factor small subunit
MKSMIDVFFFGSLSRERGEHHATCDLPRPTPLGELLEHLQILPGRVQLVMVNYRAVPSDRVIQPGDRVALFPGEYAIFADWRDFRSPRQVP